MREGWSLVGRDAELAELHSNLRGGRSIVLSGPAGVGKSRLAADAVVGLVDVGFRTRRIAGTAGGSGIPYAALVGLLGTNGEDAAHAAVAATLGTKARAAEPLPLLHVDDLHHIDDASATVLRGLVNVDAIRIVATLQTGEPLSEAVTALAGDASMLRRAVGPLAAPAVVELLTSVLDGPIDEPTGELLALMSGGNVLLLRELVESALASGALERVDEQWRLTDPPMPAPCVEDLVASRMAALDGAATQAVEVLALSEPIDLDLLSRAVDLTVVEELERIGIVAVEEHGTRLAAALVHPLYGEHVRAGLPDEARLRVFRILADAAEAVPTRSIGEELRASVWRLESGEAGERDRLLAAARLAFDAGDTVLAARLAIASFDAGGGAEAARLAAMYQETPASAPAERQASEVLPE